MKYKNFQYNTSLFVGYILKNIENIIFHFDDLNTFDTFHHLCKADVFVLGLSTFSFLAAIYNNKKVIYIPYIHQPILNNWILYN